MANGKTAKAADIQPNAAARAATVTAKMNEPLTSVIIKVPGGYIGQVEEIPGAFTQGRSVEEVRENLVEVVRLMIQTQREAAKRNRGGKSQGSVQGTAWENFRDNQGKLTKPANAFVDGKSTRPEIKHYAVWQRSLIVPKIFIS